jgi:hypothetical protein
METAYGGWAGRVFKVRTRQLGFGKGVEMEESAARSAALDEKNVLKKIETTYGTWEGRAH